MAIPKKNNSVLKKLLIKNNIDFFAGSEKNVLERYYKAALKFKGKNIIRITSDCPLIDAKLVDQTIKLYENSNSDYTSNCYPRSFPDGLDVEVFSFKALKKPF